MLGPRPAVRKLAAAMAGQRPAVPVTFAHGRVLFSLPSGFVSVEAAGAIFQAPYHGDRPSSGDVVHVLFADGSPFILGVPHGPPPLTP